MNEQFGSNPRQNNTPAMTTVVGIRAENSPNFVEAMFRCFNEKQIVAVIRNDVRPESISEIKLEKIIEPDGNAGWLTTKKTPIDDDAIAEPQPNV